MAETVTEDYYRRAAALYAATKDRAVLDSLSTAPSSQQNEQHYFCSPAKPTAPLTPSSSFAPSQRNTLGGGQLVSHQADISKCTPFPSLAQISYYRQEATHSTMDSGRDLVDFENFCSRLREAEAKAERDTIDLEYSAFLREYPLYSPHWKRWATLTLQNGGCRTMAISRLRDGLRVCRLSVDLWMALIEQIKELQEGQEATPDEVRAAYLEATQTVGHLWNAGALWRSYISWETTNMNWATVGSIYYNLMTSELPNLLGDLPSFMDDFMALLSNFSDDATKLSHPDEKAALDEVERRLLQADSHLEPMLQQRRKEEQNEREEQLARTKSEFNARENRLRENGASEEALKRLERECLRALEDVGRSLDARETRRRREEERDRSERRTSEIKTVLLETRRRGFERTMEALTPRTEFERALESRSSYHPRHIENELLQEWRRYLSWEINESSKTRPELVVRLFDRCLVVCNDYPEFWSRYCDWLIETTNDFAAARALLRKGRLELLPDNSALWVKAALVAELEQDSQTHCETAIGTIEKEESFSEARKLFVEADRLCGFKSPEVLIQRIAFEQRRNNTAAVCALFKSAGLNRTSSNPYCSITGLYSKGVDLHSCSQQDSSLRPGMSPEDRAMIELLHVHHKMDRKDFKGARESLNKLLDVQGPRLRLLATELDLQYREGIETPQRGSSHLKQLESIESEEVASPSTAASNNPVVESCPFEESPTPADSPFDRSARISAAISVFQKYLKPDLINRISSGTQTSPKEIEEIANRYVTYILLRGGTSRQLWDAMRLARTLRYSC